MSFVSSTGSVARPRAGKATHARRGFHLGDGSSQCRLGKTTFRDERKLALAMYRDLLNGDPDVTGFLNSNTERQVQFLKPLIEECKRDGYIVRNISLNQIIGFCMASVKTPIVIAAIFERPRRSKSKLLLKGNTELITNHAIAESVKMALNGIAPRR